MKAILCAHCTLVIFSLIFFDFRVDLLSKQYSDLEDEFRMALQIEANRFKEVGLHLIMINRGFNKYCKIIDL